MPLAFDTTLLLYIIITLCIGSAISALTYRWQRSAAFQWRKDAHDYLELPYYEPNPLKFTHGRSICTHCKSPLKIIDLIPIASYLFLRGKCRYCRRKISYRYPVIEFLSVVYLLPLYWAIPLSFEFVIHFILIASLICALVIDAEDYWLPDECSFIVLCCATLIFLLNNQTDILSHVSAALFAYLLIYLLRFIFLKLRNVEAIGLGDAKLLAVLVYWLSFTSITPILLGASILGLAAALIMKKDLKNKIPFGPFLITAALSYFYSGFFL